MISNYRWYTYIVALLFIIAAQFVGAYPYAQYINHTESTSSLVAQALTMVPFVTGFCALWFAMKYIHKDNFKRLITENSHIDLNIQKRECLRTA